MDKNRSDVRFRDNEDVEFAQDATADIVWVEEKGENDNNAGKTFGIFAFVLSIVSFFFLQYLLASASIILGVIGVKKGSALGWWAIALGVIAIVVNIMYSMITLPFRLFF